MKESVAYGSTTQDLTLSPYGKYLYQLERTMGGSRINLNMRDWVTGTPPPITWDGTPQNKDGGGSVDPTGLMILGGLLLLADGLALTRSRRQNT